MSKTILSHELQSILQRYVGARTNETFAAHPLRKTFEKIKGRLSESRTIQSRIHVRVVWSIGQGNWANVPWIAVLGDRETNTTQAGVYGIYLFRQDMSGVYLTFNQGVARLIKEKGKAEAYTILRSRAQALRGWSSPLRVRGFSLNEEIDLKATSEPGVDYKPSTIAHKLYEVGKIPNDDAFLADLESVLEVYEHYVEHKHSHTQIGDNNLPNEHETDFQQNTVSQALGLSFLQTISRFGVGLSITETQVIRFITSLLSKRFLILTGLAGSGKTKLAQAFARWMSIDCGWVDEADHSQGKHPNQQYALVPVGADWIGNENILGYPNGLDHATYVTTPALELIRHALEPEHAHLPHFLILDEMNLSHVERYFADILSALESGEKIPLYEGQERQAGEKVVPQKLPLPDNLFIIGTVNVDETTYMFSPKVLDRANVIEFRLESSDLGAFLASPRASKLENLDGQGAGFGEAFVKAMADKERVIPSEIKTEYEKEMLLFFNILREHNAEFGYRVAYEAARFFHFYKLLGGYPDHQTDWFNEAMDAVIAQKFLPKLHGSRSRLEGLLWALAWACGAERAPKEGKDFERQLREAGQAQDEAKYGPEALWDKLKAQDAAHPAGAARYPLSLAKVMRMYRTLVRDQFVTFAEA
ncbi:MAG: DUF3578 domain-containing protein [Anaerolineae bacterium]